MLLLVDIGNTNILIGVMDNEKVVSSFRMTTNMIRTSDEFSADFIRILNTKKIDARKIDAAVVSSVVPKQDRNIKEAIRLSFNIEPLFITPKMDSGMKIKIDDPNSLGADRLVDAVAAYDKYKQAVLVIDFGTASTFDYVDDNGDFIYGITAPGLDATSRALWEKTAKLPEVELVKPESILAKNTIESMQAGIVYGYIGLTKYIIEQVKKEIGHSFRIVATGGLGEILTNEIEEIEEYDPDLAYKGMLLLYNRSKKL